MSIEEHCARVDSLCEQGKKLCQDILQTLAEYDAQAEKRAEHERQMQELLEKV